ncbi:MAG: biotin--[acetyl-CoA-carboxylase] ligase [Alphaproteobacteria bacterium]|nr:biotin--[acetyl-CoA-carboxylase] ligase [Alphaproteobacteria bacterium]MBU0798386.1 biotin--[acetyl-CoA-carboxylase] ligase [Alphaproteobacteria bacterium]MBU0887799.1 biotin--[acetyl-CoA-carboxylase] ligase [Alphaproteobacteria bacterium]MBU1814978.1 biotin--[acetyl-CoA-carboxylase] ligase [Alphaproteobacteria bacterium]
MTGHHPSFDIVVLGSVGSTNDEAHQLAREGARHLTVVSAAEQSGGRGRRGRAWASPPGNVYVSMILRPDCAPAQAAQISFLAALAVRDTARSALGDSSAIKVKWPNDVLVGGSKISGILLETGSVAAEAVDYVVIGIGLNVLHHPEDSERPSTSLAAQGASFDTSHARATLLERLGYWYHVWHERGFAPVRESWLADAAGKGEEIEVRLPDRVLKGVFADLDEDGALLLETVQGRQRIAAGDVYLRPSAS